MSATVVALIKLGAALGAAGASYWLGRGSSRAASAVLAACAALAVCAYFQFGRLPAGFVHRWEMFHYYVGSKYHAELGYERLYTCAAIADAEDGLAASPRRLIRDLATDGTVHAAVIAQHPETCKAHFSAARWSDFRRDVRFFRKGLGRRQWEQAQLDHGYNPPPLWTTTWGALANRVPATWSNVRWLASIDLLLMAGVLVALTTAFGWRAAALGAVFWGTQAASEVGWTGGGFVRQDWLFCAVAGIALLRLQRFGWAGAALMLAGLLRVFPALLLAAVVLVWLWRWGKERRPPRALSRFALGALVCVTLAGGASVASQGASDHRQFWSHIQLRREAIVSNHMGLRTLIAGAPLEVNSVRAPDEPHWVSQRRQRLAILSDVHRVVLVGGVLLVLAAIIQARQAWAAAALGTALIPLLLDPSNYYYSFFVLLVPLMRKQPALAVLLCVIAAGGQLLGLRFAADASRFFALSCLYVAAALFLALAFVRWPRSARFVSLHSESSI
ncbi:MAG TPA: hypothetical protein VHB79_31920 [Polyangiaceae bacterium]|nr:hypothetical protein [Polyangiaceae bacterium]